MRRSRLLSLCLFAGVPAALMACSSSSDMPPLPMGEPPRDAGPNQYPDAAHHDAHEKRDGHVTDSGRPADTGTVPTDAKTNPFDGANLCAVTTSGAPPVETLAQPGAPPPATGGPLPAPGTYVLKSVLYYPETAEAGGPTGGYEQGTIVFGGGTYGWAIAQGTTEAGVGTPTITGGSYSPSGTNLVLDQHCPEADAGTIVSYPYSAAGTGIFIYRSSATTEFYDSI
jgi:hypothetical protein